MLVVAMRDINVTITATQLSIGAGPSSKLETVPLPTDSRQIPPILSDDAVEQPLGIDQPSVVNTHAAPGVQACDKPSSDIFPMLSAVFGGLSLLLTVVLLPLAKAVWGKICARFRSADSDLESGGRLEGTQA